MARREAHPCFGDEVRASTKISACSARYPLMFEGRGKEWKTGLPRASIKEQGRRSVGYRASTVGWVEAKPKPIIRLAIWQCRRWVSLSLNPSYDGERRLHPRSEYPKGEPDKGCYGNEKPPRPQSPWTFARRRRRPGRLRQDRADGRALQEVARSLRDRRHHQRHLHQVGRRISGALRRAARRAHRRRRDRRLPAYGDPRGCLDQSRRRRRDARRSFPISIWC